MKYIRLTKEQLEELHPEFITFLATQTITADEWTDLKKTNPQVAEDEIDIFSDLIWEGVLSKVNYLENYSKNQLYLFHLDSEEMHLILLKTENEEVNFLTKEGLLWLEQNILNDDVSIFKASKEYTADKNMDIFQLIQQGAVITDGELFKSVKRVVG